MPVRSLNSAVLKWPDREEVLNKALLLAGETAAKDKSIIRIIAYGSVLSPTRWGVGSDLDIIIEVSDSGIPFVERGRYFDFTIPGIPVDMCVYTTREIESMEREGRGIFHKPENILVLLDRRERTS